MLSPVFPPRLPSVWKSELRQRASSQFRAPSQFHRPPHSLLRSCVVQSGLLGIDTKVALTPWCQTYFTLTNWLLLINCFLIGVIAKFEWKTPSVHICTRCDLPFLVRISGPLLLLVPMFLPPLCPSRPSARRAICHPSVIGDGVRSEVREWNCNGIGVESNSCHGSGTLVICFNYSLRRS